MREAGFIILCFAQPKTKGGALFRPGLGMARVVHHNRKVDRRNLIRFLALASVSSLCGCASHTVRSLFSWEKPLQKNKALVLSDSIEDSNDIGEVQGVSAPQEGYLSSPQELTGNVYEDLKARSLYFNREFPNDIYFREEKFELIKSLLKKFRAVQSHVGHGNFNVMGMDDFFRFANVAAGSTEVTTAEKKLLEEIFYFDAKKYGFQGQKVIHQFTETFQKNSVVKMPYTGHFLRKGYPVEVYNRILKDVGPSLILTSGVRALAKQYHLFFEKSLESNGNLSKASRSLAPPGYSFHGQGDFDIGKRGYGFKNFTDEFAKTDEFKRLIDLGYIEVRYPESNLLGVRFEPWHIKVPFES